MKSEEKFKVGDIVQFTNKMNGLEHLPKVEFDNKQRKIVSIDYDEFEHKYLYDLEGLPNNCFTDEELKLINEFEVGDIVKINKNATIDDFTKDCWGGCQITTLKFIEEYGDQDDEFEVVEIGHTYLILKDILDEDCINKNIFEVVRHKEVHEMTVKELEEKFLQFWKFLREDK